MNDTIALTVLASVLVGAISAVGSSLLSQAAIKARLDLFMELIRERIDGVEMTAKDAHSRIDHLFGPARNRKDTQ